jgi:hypothetical protein
MRGLDQRIDQKMKFTWKMDGPGQAGQVTPNELAVT